MVVALLRGGPGEAAQPLTVADALSTTRALRASTVQPIREGGGVTQSEIFVSPNEKNYAAVLIRTDVRRNGNWLELWSAPLTSPAAASRPRRVARLFTRSLGDVDGYGADILTVPGLNTVQWIDDSTVAFLADRGTDDPGRSVQVVSVNVQTGARRWLTHHRSNVTRFDVGPGMEVLASASPVQPSHKEALKHGFSVESPDAFSLLAGDVDGQISRAAAEKFFSHVQPGIDRTISTRGTALDTWNLSQPARFSHDGRYATTDWAVESVPARWMAYTDPILKTSLAEADGPGGDLRVAQLVVVDLVNAKARPLVDAPLRAGAAVSWSPHDASLVVGPTFLPVEAPGTNGLSGNAIAEIDVGTGAVHEVPISSEQGQEVVGLQWRTESTLSIRLRSGGNLEATKSDGTWTVRQTPNRQSDQQRIAVIVEQDIATPPRIVVTDPRSGQTRIALDLNPNLLSKFELGAVEERSWRDKSGRAWQGDLFLPVGFDQSRKYPLVIQTSLRRQSHLFSLFGGGDIGLGASYSAYAAQVLATRGIAVLELREQSLPGARVTPAEAVAYMDAYESAAESLIKDGLADPGKVGLVGFSRSGWYVEYTLAHSTFAFAAAVVVDNFDGGYFQAALAGWEPEYSLDNGDVPFGRGLRKWIENAPGFNAEHVKAPLQIQAHQAGLRGVLGGWEMFSRLRQLGKPVELYAIPDIEHGSHGLQNPQQCQAAKERAVDWFDFWLNGRQQPQKDKEEEYAQWRRLRSMASP